jgi:hypothetical protein
MCEEIGAFVAQEVGHLAERTLVVWSACHCQNFLFGALRKLQGLLLVSTI